MNKKFFSIFKKIIIVLIVFILIVLSLSSLSYAQGGMPNAGELQSMGENFINKGEHSAKIDVNKIAEIMKPLASLLLGIGTVVLVIVTAIMGIKYMAATPETRAKLKTQLIGIAVSAIVLFGAYGIWSITYRIISDITK